MSYKVVLQYQHHGGIASWTLDSWTQICLSGLTSGQEVVQAEMLLYMTAT